jgi:hypothetical protein
MQIQEEGGSRTQETATPEEVKVEVYKMYCPKVVA